MSAPPLSEMQQWMLNALIWSGEQTSPDDINARVLPSPTLAPAQRLGIYQRGYYLRLLQCMEGQYKALSHALGRDLFRDFATEYLRQYPSASTTLSDLGARFPQWLSENRPDRETEEKEEWIDFMVELAKYEWGLYLFFDKEGHEGMPLATTDTPDELIIPQTSLELKTCLFPVADYYHRVAQGEDPPIPEARMCPLALVRKDYRIGIYNLLEPQYALLTALMAGTPIAEALEACRIAMNRTEDDFGIIWRVWKEAWCGYGFFGIRPTI